MKHIMCCMDQMRFEYHRRRYFGCHRAFYCYRNTTNYNPCVSVVLSAPMHHLSKLHA